MRARLPVIGFRLAVLVAVWLLGTATFSLAQEGGSTTPQQPAQTGQTAPAVTEADPEPLVVPDVRGLPYVFAKGVLEDAGFAWKVKGKVEGYAVNLVTGQSVKPGTRVLDTGAPTVVLQLEKNPDYEERGLPESTSPYTGTALVLANGEEPAPAKAPETDQSSTEQTQTADATETTTGPEATETEPATTSTEPVETTDSTAEPAATEPAEAGPAATSVTTAKPKAVPKKRPPAFIVPGAPREPLDEIPLPLRAKRLQQRIASAPGETKELLDFWAYQHAWIVAGARFGWWQGARALRILIRVDEDVQERFGWGSSSEAEARAALAEVLKKSQL